ncbi:MAG: hypothetical protein OXF26_02575 [Alphaproteobacteria bacterium]|nr:hypothetical protein [Alphaproteobacteria bacterium]MCY4229769.1 hypothetical protein [Alphaproteobacteria bacterium]
MAALAVLEQNLAGLMIDAGDLAFVAFLHADPLVGAVEGTTSPDA